MWLQNILLWADYLFVCWGGMHVLVGVFEGEHVCGGSSYTSEPEHVEIKGSLSVVIDLMFSGRASPRDRESPIKLDCMLLPRTQVLSPAPT